MPAVSLAAGDDECERDGDRADWAVLHDAPPGVAPSKTAAAVGASGHGQFARAPAL